MPTTITVRDENATGQSLREFVVELLTERVTARELIRARVYQEVKDFNAKGGTLFRGLVQPSEAERTLNGFRLQRHRTIDWEQQFAKAIEAFEVGRVLLLVDNRQVDELEEQIDVGPGIRVSFLKLVPLVGG